MVPLSGVPQGIVPPREEDPVDHPEHTGDLGVTPIVQDGNHPRACSLKVYVDDEVWTKCGSGVDQVWTKCE